MTNAIKSQGTLVYLSNENASTTAYGSSTFTKLSETATVGESSGEAADIDVTHLESTAKEYLIGLPDNGNLPLSGNFVPGDTGQTRAIYSLDNQQYCWLKIIWSNGTIWYYMACCKKFTPSADVDGKVPFTSSWRTSGPRVII